MTAQIREKKQTKEKKEKEREREREGSNLFFFVLRHVTLELRRTESVLASRQFGHP